MTNILLDLTISEDSIALHRPYSEEGSLDLFEENLLRSFTDELSTPGLLPPGVLYCNNPGSLVVFERPPRYQTIVFTELNKAQASKHDKEYFSTFILPLPWQIYVAQFHSSGELAGLAVFFADSEVDKVDYHLNNNYIKISLLSRNYLRVPALTNIYNDLFFCIDQQLTYGNNFNLETKVAAAYDAVWGTVFNCDLIDAFQMGLTQSRNHWKKLNPNIFKKGTGFFEFWSSLSIKDTLTNIDMFATGSQEISMKHVDITNFFETSQMAIINYLPQLV